MEETERLFDRREHLTNKLRALNVELDNKLGHINKIYRPEIDKIIVEIHEIRSKLYDLGVSAEDC